MSQVILAYPMSIDDLDLDKGTDPHKLSIELGNGVRLTTSLPSWVGDITEVTIHIILEVNGSPPDANIGSTPKQ